MNADSGFSCQNDYAMKIIPADDVIADLERKAADCEAKLGSEPEPIATQLREKAKAIRAWVADLKAGRWVSVIGLSGSPHSSDRRISRRESA